MLKTDALTVNYCIFFSGEFTANMFGWCTRAQTQNIVIQWFTTYVQIQVHNVVLCS